VSARRIDSAAAGSLTFLRNHSTPLHQHHKSPPPKKPPHFHPWPPSPNPASRRLSTRILFCQLQCYRPPEVLPRIAGGGGSGAW